MRPHGLNIVAIGGGTGLSTLLRGLKRYVGGSGAWSIARLGAIVTVTDEGGSSGALRKELAREVAISGSLLGDRRRAPRSHARVVHLALDPPDCQPPARALDALRAADLILIGPGSLYTSVIPNLLIKPVADELRQARALRVYICNVMTQPGETEGYKAEEHLSAIIEHAGLV